MYLQQKRQKSDLVNIKDYIPDVFVDLKYATEDNFTGHRVYDFSERATDIMQIGIRKLLRMCSWWKNCWKNVVSALMKANGGIM